MPILLEELEDPNEAQAYLNHCFKEGEIWDVLEALRMIAKAQGGISKLARETGLSRPNLSDALSENGNPRFDSIQKVLRSLGMQMQVQPLRAKGTTRAPRPVRSAKDAPARRTTSGPKRKSATQQLH